MAGSVKDERRAQVVMGPALGGDPSHSASDKSGEPGKGIGEVEDILADVPDDAVELDLTHLRLKSLRDLGLTRFRNVRRVLLRQNMLTQLTYDATSCELETATSEDDLISNSDAKEELDEDSHDDEDAQRKESNIPHTIRRSHALESRVLPLNGLPLLEELDLYDNSLKSIEGLENLRQLRSLDLSFNLLRSMACMDGTDPDSPYLYPRLTHLYAIQNKLNRIEGVRHRMALSYLELGGNRIRVIENLPISANLRSLFLGKNKISKIENLEGLTGLRTLSIQSNRITKIEGLETLIELDELYLSHNGLVAIEGLHYNTKLTTLDLGNNAIIELPANEIASLKLLEELWLNDNQISSLPTMPKETHRNLKTIYLEGNPVQKELSTGYRRKIMLAMPQVTQIDATLVR